jgi:hypothetical protein
MIEQPETTPAMIEEPEVREIPPPPALFIPPPKSVIREYFEQALITIILALFLMTFIAQAVQVPTGSMQNNINIGDNLFVNKFIFGRPTPWLRRPRCRAHRSRPMPRRWPGCWVWSR